MTDQPPDDLKHLRPADIAFRGEDPSYPTSIRLQERAVRNKRMRFRKR